MKHRKCVIVCGFVCIALAILTSPAEAQLPLNVDFGISDPSAGPHVPNPNDVQAGWEELSVPHDLVDGSDGRDGVNGGPASGTYGGISITVGGLVSGGPSSRDRLPDLNSASSLGDMLEDVFNDVSQITIGGLPSGTYEVTSYHHDSGFGGSEADIFVDGTQVGNVTATHHNSIHYPISHPNRAPEERDFGSATYNVTSDGSTDIVIDFFEPGTSTPDAMHMSGLSIVPEPATISLILLGVFGGFGLFRRMRR